MALRVAKHGAQTVVLMTSCCPMRRTTGETL